MKVGEAFISAASYVETQIGLARGGHHAAAQEPLAVLVAEFPVLPFEEAAAKAYARLPFRHHRFHRLFAAHALALGAAVATRNPHVPELQVEDWSRP